MEFSTLAVSDQLVNAGENITGSPNIISGARSIEHMSNNDSFVDGLVRDKDRSQIAVDKFPAKTTEESKMFAYSAHEVHEAHYPRARNAFILYRQWMSAKLHDKNPGLTAGSISQIVASLWRREKSSVKRHFHKLGRDGKDQYMDFNGNTRGSRVYLFSPAVGEKLILRGY